MSITIIQDTMTKSLTLDLDRKTANRILSGPDKSEGFFNDVSWKLVVGDSSEKKRTQAFHCYLRKKGWFTEIIYLLSTADPNKPTLTIKSNPTEVDIKQYATKATKNEAPIYKNPIMILDKIFTDRLFSTSERKRIDNQDLEISDVEVAIPLITSLSKSGVLRVLRSTYGSDFTLSDGTSSVAESLEIRYNPHADRQSKFGNISLSVYSGKHHHFTVTFYDKIEQMLSVNRKIDIADRDVWEKYLRMDIRITRQYLQQYLGVKHNLSDWVNTMQNGEFKKLLQRILYSRLRLCDVMIPEGDFTLMDKKIKRKFPDFHSVWRKATTLTTEQIKAHVSYKIYKEICDEFRVRPTTGGDLLAVACRTSLFQNVTRDEFLGDTKILLKSMLQKAENKPNTNSIDDIKIKFIDDLDKLCT